MKNGNENVIEMKAGELRALLKALAPFAAKCAPQAVRIEADASSNTLTFAVSGGERAAEARTVPNRGTVRRPARCFVGFPALAGFVGVEDAAAEAFDNEGEAVVLALSDEALTLCGQGSAARRRLKLPASAPEAHPALAADVFPRFERDEDDAAFAFESAKDFAALLALSAAAACGDAERAALHGVCLRFSAREQTLTLASADGLTAQALLAAHEPQNSVLPAADADALFPLEGVSALLSALKNAGAKSRLTLNFRDEGAGKRRVGYWEFSTAAGDSVHVALPCAAPAFPDFSPLFAPFRFPAAVAAASVSADALRGILSQMMKTAQEGANEAAAHLDFSGIAEPPSASHILIADAGDAELADYTAELPASPVSEFSEKTPLPPRALFRAKLLADALDAFAGERILLCFAGDDAARLLIVPADAADLSRLPEAPRRRLVMGMNVNNGKTDR